MVFTYPLKLRLTIKKRIIYKSALFIFIAYFLARSVKTSINYDRTSLDKMHPYYFFFEKYPKITRMKVLYILHATNMGGATISFLNMVKGLVDLGVDPLIVVPQNVLILFS